MVVLVSLGRGLGAPLLHRLNALGTLLVVGQSACLIGVLAILESLPSAGAGMMTMGTMGCSGAAVGARGAARPVGLVAACTLGENGGVGRRGPTRGRGGGR